MIISWFSQPEGSLSSYYQYDTVTTNFTRIRLELGRASSTGSTDDTFISYKTERYVGFSDQRYSTIKSNLGHWSVNSDNELCYDGAPLAGGRPAAGAKIYDCTDPSSFVHRGNPVTDTPTLPEGIAPKHLALLANDTFGGSRDTMTKLTGSGATAADVSKALKKAVCDVLEVDDFAKITDEEILTKLTSQVETIRINAILDKAGGLETAVTEAGKQIDLISEQITEGSIVPNEQLTTAFGSLQEALAKTQTAENPDAMRAVLVEVSNAQQAVTTAIETIDVTHREQVAERFGAAEEALAEVHLQAIEMRTAETAYEKLTEATDVADYEKEIFEGTEEVI